jgi:dnd system-associated protein 4
MPRRINHSESRKLILKSFKESRSPHKVFQEFWEVQLFAAALAFQRNQLSKLTDVNSGSAIDFNSFAGSYMWPGFMNAMSLVKEGQPDVLNSESEEDRIAFFEQYADAGLEILNNDAVHEMNVIQLADYILEITQAPDGG